MSAAQCQMISSTHLVGSSWMHSKIVIWVACRSPPQYVASEPIMQRMNGTHYQAARRGTKAGSEGKCVGAVGAPVADCNVSDAH